MNATWRKNGLVYLLIIVAVAVLFYSMSQSSERPAERNLSEIASLIMEGKVAKVVVSGDQIEVTTSDKQSFVAQKEDNVNLTSTLVKMGVTAELLSKIEFKVAPPADMGGWLTIVGTVLPLVLIGGLFLMIMRQAQGSNSQAMSFGKSKARVFTGDKPTVTFQDVAGAEESKQELQEVVEFLKEPQKFASLGARIPKGVLLIGPPGTGKTLMAKAISGEAGVPFFSISGSEFVEMFVGVGASRVRDLFEQAKRNSPCLIFIDEIDAVGGGAGPGWAVATTARADVEPDPGGDGRFRHGRERDPDRRDEPTGYPRSSAAAPGRFDRQVVMDQPDAKGREAILNVHVKGKPLEPDVDLRTLRRGRGLCGRGHRESGERGGDPGAGGTSRDRNAEVPGGGGAGGRRAGSAAGSSRPTRRRSSPITRWVIGRRLSTWVRPSRDHPRHADRGRRLCGIGLAWTGAVGIRRISAARHGPTGNRAAGRSHRRRLWCDRRTDRNRHARRSLSTDRQLT